MASAIGAPSAAHAVDVVNRDNAPRQAIVNRADGSSETLNLKPGERAAKICTDCVILVGSSSVEAKGDVTAKIEGGKVSIGSQR